MSERKRRPKSVTKADTRTTPANGESEDIEEAFWTARPILEDLRTFAQANMVSSWATLGAVLVRALSIVPPRVVLPRGFGGGEGSLNLFVALVGRSSQGKGGAENVARDFLSIDPEPVTVTVGSGEGIPKMFAFKRMTKEGPEQVNERNTVIFSTAEVDTLTALQERNGSTLIQQLRSAWSGERLGFAYADPAKFVNIERHRYRLSLVVGVQPLRAGRLMEDADGGTPQRFLWFPTAEPESPELIPTEPASWSLTPWASREGPKGKGSARIIGEATTGVALLEDPVTREELTVLTIPEEARQFMIDHRKKNLRDKNGSGVALDGHASLARLKVAAALMTLDGRCAEITGEDWTLAGVIQEVSNRERAYVEQVLADKSARDNVTRGRSRGIQDVAAEDVRDTGAVQRVAKNICKHLEKEEDNELGAGKIKNKIKFKDRDHFEEAVAHLVAAGIVEELKRKGQGMQRRILALIE